MANSPGYSITVRVEVPAAAGVGAAGPRRSRAGGAAHRPRRRRVARRPARRRRHLRRLRRRARRRHHRRDRRCRRSVGAQGQRPHLPACTSAARSRSTRRCRSSTATTCPAPTPPVSPGSAWPSPSNPEDVRRLTIKRNTVAVVTDGSAVLGLGNIGPAAAMPVMEGKAALFKQFAGVDAWPVCLDTQDTDEIVEIVRAIAPVYGGINLEDIAAPALLRDRARLRELLDIPVFHDDQHGTAIVVLAALTNALRVVGKQLDDVADRGQRRRRRRPRDHPAAARPGGDRHHRLRPARRAAHPSRPTLDPFRRWIADHTNPRGRTGTLREVLAGADVFIGVSAPNLLTGDDIATMADGRDRLRAGQPRPRGRPVRGREARRGGRDRSLGLPEPDQQRAGLPRLLPRHARRRRARDHRRGDARRRGRDRRLRRAGRAERQLHRPVRVRPACLARRRRRRPQPQPPDPERL